MIRNKLNKRILAGVLTLAVALPLFVTNVAKADDTLAKGRVDYYTFDSQTLKNEGSSKAVATAYGKAFANYTDDLTYVSGRSGKDGDYAIDLSKCGLRLNDANIGDNFTVSVWVKPVGTFTSWAQNIVFLGYHNPEKWLAVAGTGARNTETVMWSNDKVNNKTSWTQFGRTSLVANEWNNVILTGDGTSMAYYLNGKLVKSTTTMNPLTGENQDVHIGLDNWDNLFPGYADDIMVYNRTLSESEINQIYTGKALDDLIEEKPSVGDISEYLVGEYDFDGNINNKVENGGVPVAKQLTGGTGTWADYSNVKYSEGYDGQALQLNGYGLKLNVGKLGKEFTVSFGVKTDKNLATNQIMMTTGHHSPENWFAISGDGGAGRYKVWGNGGALTTWTTRFSPTFTAGQWYQVTMVGSDGKVTLYVNGKSLGTQDYNDPMNVENADIYLGVNNWDTEFDGAFDNVKVYNIALSQADVESIDFVAVSKMAESSLKAAMNSAEVLGDNASDSDIKFNLNFPKKVMGLDVTIESSDGDVIAADGIVTNPKADKEVKVTAKVSVNGNDTKVEKTYTVKAIDRTELDKLLAKAEKVDTTYITAVCQKKLAEVIEEGKKATSFTEIDAATEHIAYVLEHLEYTGIITDPFSQIVEPKVYTTIDFADGPVTFFTIPESIANMVDVEYTTGNEQVATVEDGIITPVSEGKTIITAIVTSRTDGYKVEYSTATEVKGTPIVVCDHNATVEYVDGKFICGSCEADLGDDYTGFAEKANGKYYFVEGIAQSGWQQVDGNWYYCETGYFLGRVRVGEHKIGYTTYTFDENGILVRGGFRNYNGFTYYYWAGVYQTGWQTIDGKTYYFNENGSKGHMQTGIVEIDGKFYEFADNGILVGKCDVPNGFVKNTDGIFCYEKGTVKTGWFEVDGKWYFGKTVAPNVGVLRTGVSKVNSVTYSFDENGVLVQGGFLVKDSGTTYYYFAGKKVKNSFVEHDGNTYYFDWLGRMKTGTVKIDGTAYIFDENGVRQ